MNWALAPLFLTMGRIKALMELRLTTPLWIRRMGKTDCKEREVGDRYT